MNPIVQPEISPAPSHVAGEKSQPCADESLFTRYAGNPILGRKDWPYPVNSVFNAAATRLADGDTLLLCRVEDRRGLSHLCVARSANGLDDWRIDPRPDGSPAPDGPAIEVLEDKLELIAAGQAVAIVAAGFRGIRPDLTTVGLSGIEPSHVVLATRIKDRTRLVDAFRKCARRHLTGPPTGVPTADGQRSS